MTYEQLLLDNLRVCEHRLPNGMCGAIGFEEKGDTPCECCVCDRYCEKEKAKCDTD